MSSETDAAAGPVELEAKFAFDLARLEQLERGLAVAYGKPRQRLQLRNTYFDTPDHRLRQVGVALRIRSTALLAEGDGTVDLQVLAPESMAWEQTVKARGTVTGGLHSRSEWNHPLGNHPSDAPVPELDQRWLEALATSELPGLAGFDWSQLRPLFNTDFERLIWWHEGAVNVELALDQGAVSAGGKTTALCELEVELKRGGSEAFNEFLGAFRTRIEQSDETEPALELQPSEISKAARGYLLAGKADFLTPPEDCQKICRLSWHAIADRYDAQVPEAWSGAVAGSGEAGAKASMADAGQEAPTAEQAWLNGAAAQIARAFCVSDFLAETLKNHLPAVVRYVADSLNKTWQKADFEQLLTSLGAGAPDEDEAAFNAVLRKFRTLAQFRIVWRDLVVCNTVEETTREESWLAELCLQAAHDFWMQRLGRRHGYPIAAGKPQPLVILGMGKLGSFELNVSSDIDLIFLFEQDCGETSWPEGETPPGKLQSLDTPAFYRKLCQGIIAAIDQRTADGFVFRVDMRLRPFGRDGALAISFSAAEHYYFNQGRYWERFAMLKARAVAGDIKAGSRLLANLSPFIFRNYIDFTAIQALREMKAMIEQEVVRRSLKNNIKLGAGGIRELEFVVQVMQLMHGGRQVMLRQGSLFGMLEKLEKLRLLEPKECAGLAEAYAFLRNLEHALQGLRDQQTQLLPVDDRDQSRIAFAMNEPDYPQLLKTLARHRKIVRQVFNSVVTPATQAELIDLGLVAQDQQTGAGVLDDVDCTECWRIIAGAFGVDITADSVPQRHDKEVAPDPAAVRQQLLAQGLQPGALGHLDELLELADRLLHYSQFRQLRPAGVRRFHALMPTALGQLFRYGLAPWLSARFFALLEQVIGRSVHMSLLIENPLALHELMSLLHDSEWIAEQLISLPVLLNELVQHKQIYTPPDVATLTDQLRQELLRIPEEDLEEQMDALRYFKRAHELRVAASEIRETLPLMKVSDYLSAIAEAMLGEALHFAWQDVVHKYGRPMRDATTPCDPDFAIIAYGKLGGLELSYSSDLDLVFLHDADDTLETDGEKPVENSVFFARLGQRIIHFLSTRTVRGELYETDMRLRPSGNSGLLVSTLTAFERYQRERAWTWELQALTRARFVAGCPRVGEKFMAVRQRVLCAERDPVKLSRDVLEMREKMRTQFAVDAKSSLKHAAGGIVDIEFMVQYAVLRWAHDFPTVARWSDNIRMLEELSSRKCVDPEAADCLIAIYQLFRSELHSKTLGLTADTTSHEAGDEPEPDDNASSTNYAATVETGEALVARMLPQREKVSALWQRWFEPSTSEDEETK
ncbi:bifunctional [glutamate--ammonia ligase]-adenylyl-L-tyrosine phosphorylase/[glutamate--ammonia-ligase] adenylyltransferase [Allohahella marinimesophila]|uniref:Bifunctional glutamine synthetase adenylyltransferase/adenylyl-removing enzyme n=1 Tax=Allohahella marinimesophila TaxID=1054972 RepID=A0ABP7PKA8_9GAMM